MMYSNLGLSFRETLPLNLLQSEAYFYKNRRTLMPMPTSSTFIEANERGRSSKLTEESEMGESLPLSPELLPELWWYPPDRAEPVLHEKEGQCQNMCTIASSSAKEID